MMNKIKKKHNRQVKSLKRINIMELYFIAAGIENGQIPFISKFKYSDLINNTGDLKDTEIFYTLKELVEPEIHAFLNYCTPFEFRTSRDNEDCKAIFTRVSKQRYDETITTN